MSASTGTTVATLVVVLAVLGLGMIALAVWLLRTTRTDPRALGPLEVMGDRSWRRGGAERRQANLDTARPEGAPSPAPMVPHDSADGDAAEAGADEASPGASPENSDVPALEPAGSGQSSDGSPVDGAEPLSESESESESAAESAPENSESSMEESVVSAHGSADPPADGGESDGEADRTE